MTLKREKFLNCLLVQTSFSTENSIFHRLTTLCVKRAFKCVYKTYTKILSLLPEAGEIIVTKAEGKFSARPSLNKDLQSYKVIGKNTLYHSLIQSYNSVYMLNINHLNRSSHCLQWSVVKFHLSFSYDHLHKITTTQHRGMCHLALTRTASVWKQ